MSGFKQTWATKFPTGGTTWCLGVFQHFCMNYISCIFFSNSQSRTAEMKEETNKKHQLWQDCKKRQLKKQKACGINLGTKSEGSGINFVPQKRCLFHSKNWCWSLTVSESYALHPVIPGVKECFLARWPQNHTQYLWLVRRWVIKEINNNLGI